VPVSSVDGAVWLQRVTEQSRSTRPGMARRVSMSFYHRMREYHVEFTFYVFEKVMVTVDAAAWYLAAIAGAVFVAFLNGDNCMSDLC